MPTRIVIEVCGGTYCEVYTADPSVEVVLVDWDTSGFEPGDHFVHAVGEGDGERLVLVVPGYPTTTPAKMPVDTRRALERAGVGRPPLTLADLAKQGVV